MRVTAQSIQTASSIAELYTEFHFPKNLGSRSSKMFLSRRRMISEEVVKTRKSRVDFRVCERHYATMLVFYNGLRAAGAAPLQMTA